MATGDVYQVTIFALTPAGFNLNTLAFITTTPDDALPPHFLAIGNAMKELHRGDQANTTQYLSYRARRVRGTGVTYPSTGPCGPVGGEILEGNLTGTLIGQGVGDGLPPQAAFVTTIRTGVPGRSHRGRFYAGSGVESMQAGGQWSAAAMLNANNAWTSFFNAYAVPAPTSGYRLGVWSMATATGFCYRTPTGDHIRRTDPHPELAFTPATQYVCRQTIYTQRRRVLGVGI